MKRRYVFFPIPMPHRVEAVINFENPADFEAVDKMLERGREELLISRWWYEDCEEMADVGVLEVRHRSEEEG